MAYVVRPTPPPAQPAKTTITCPSCQGTVSRRANSCPHCGEPFGRNAGGIVLVFAWIAWYTVVAMTVAYTRSHDSHPDANLVGFLIVMAVGVVLAAATVCRAMLVRRHAGAGAMVLGGCGAAFLVLGLPFLALALVFFLARPG